MSRTISVKISHAAGTDLQSNNDDDDESDSDDYDGDDNENDKDQRTENIGSMIFPSSLVRSGNGRKRFLGFFWQHFLKLFSTVCFKILV